MQVSRNIAIIVTSSYQIDNFLAQHVLALAENNQVNIISNSASTLQVINQHPNVNNFNVPFVRKPSPLKDLSCMLQVIKILKKQKIDIYYSMSPKAGLIAALSGFVARVKRRVNFFTGQVWVTRLGFWKIVLKSLDKLTGLLITHAVIDSHSQSQFLIQNRILNRSKAFVIGDGSVCGVNVKRFTRYEQDSIAIRKKYSIKSDDTVILFLGRLTTDKGIFDLLEAFILIKNKFENLHLLFTGPDDGFADDLTEKIKASGLESVINITGSTSEPEKYFSAADIFCLPSYREGFGQVALEASCIGIPTVGYDIYGLSDAVLDKHTGLLTEKGMVENLASSLETLIVDKDSRKRMGDKARERVLEKYSTKAVVKNFIDFHSEIMEVKK